MKAHIVTSVVKIAPARCWLRWENTSPVATATPSPPSKKAKLPGGQLTLTQMMSPPSSPSASDPGLASTPISVTNLDASSTSSPVVIENETLAALLSTYHHSLTELVEQIKCAYPWFNNQAFDQWSWIHNDLPIAISSIKASKATVSVMGRRDMNNFLPQIKD